MSALIEGLAARKRRHQQRRSRTATPRRGPSPTCCTGRPPFAKRVTQTDRAHGIVVADHDYFDNLLNTLPDTYQVLARQGMYGDYFSFYLCDAVLKLNGKGGQPVYVKVAGPDHGTVCAAMKSFSERNPTGGRRDRRGRRRGRRAGALQYDKLPFFTAQNASTPPTSPNQAV